MENKCTYHIIGAGIAGLCAAKIIKETIPDAYIIIYEAAKKCGGRCGSNYNKKLNCNIDNAPHVILNRNKCASTFIESNLSKQKINFYNPKQCRFINKLYCYKDIELAIFNTENTDIKLKLYSLIKLLPFWGIRAYFSDGELENILCTPLLKYGNEIKYNYKWKGIITNNNYVSQLIFNKECIKIQPTDKIISAVDSFNYNKIIGGYDFDYNTITNIFYRTSMALTLPKNNKMLGIYNGISHWLFTTKDYIVATISNSKKENNAIDIWQEICNIRNYNAAFVPTYKVIHHPHATICQNQINNDKRPVTAKTQYENLFICGDWTMKNQPCCIETAINSARRLKKFI